MWDLREAGSEYEVSNGLLEWACLQEAHNIWLQCEHIDVSFARSHPKHVPLAWRSTDVCWGAGRAGSLFPRSVFKENHCGMVSILINCDFIGAFFKLWRPLACEADCWSLVVCRSRNPAIVMLVGKLSTPFRGTKCSARHCGHFRVRVNLKNNLKSLSCCQKYFLARKISFTCLSGLPSTVPCKWCVDTVKSSAMCT